MYPVFFVSVSYPVFFVSVSYPVFFVSVSYPVFFVSVSYPVFFIRMCQFAFSILWYPLNTLKKWLLRLYTPCLLVDFVLLIFLWILPLPKPLLRHGYNTRTGNRVMAVQYVKYIQWGGGHKNNLLLPEGTLM